MSRHPHVPLLPGWIDDSRDVPDEPLMFYRESGYGRLQVSLWSLGTFTTHSALAPAGLEELAVGVGEEQLECGPAKHREHGECAAGNLGTARFAAPPEHPFGQVWVLFDGRDFVLATYVALFGPDPDEVREADEIVRAITIVGAESN